MIKEFKINERIVKRIESSKLEKPIKDFLKKILEIEAEIGKFSPRYSKLYKDEIEKTFILLRGR
ncbi:MAG: hypothetical protein WA139_01890 [Candidatus Aenigmatarchaeota archaeon]